MNKFSLSALLSKVNLEKGEKEVCADGLKGITGHTEQLDFFNYCKQWKLAPWIYLQLKKHDLTHYLDSKILHLFQTEHSKILDQNTKRNITAKIFLNEFIKEGIDIIVLKGNYLAHTCYQDVGYKRMNDFDILIHKKDWDRIQDIYLRLGYIPLGFGWSGEKEEPASFSHVGMSFISSDYSCIIGSQWGLKSPTTPYSVNLEKIWDTARPFEFEGLSIKCLTPEYNLLHLILHLGVFKCGIRDCMDLYNLTLIETINENLMQEILIESNALNKAKFALEISNLCVPVFSQEFVDGLDASKKGFLARRLKKRKKLTQLTGDLHDSYNDYFQDIEKQVVYFNLFPKFHIKFIFYIKILRMIYFPKIEFSLRLNDKLKQASFGNKFISALKAPYFVFSLIAQEIGWKFTFLLFIKLFVDLLVSLKNYFIKSESYFDYLEKKGIDPKDIKKAVKNIQ